MIDNMKSWPFPQHIKELAAGQYQAMFAGFDKELLDSPGHWLWTRCRELMDAVKA